MDTIRFAELRNIGFISFPCAHTVAAARSAPTCSLQPLSRRQVLHLTAITAAAAWLPAAPARSENLYERGVRREVNKARLGLDKAKVLLKTVGTWSDNVGEDNELVLYRYSALWLQPAQVALDFIGSQQNADVGDAQKVQTYAAALKGHLLELNMEAKGRKKEGVLRELDEYVETVQDFLELPGIARYVK